MWVKAVNLPRFCAAGALRGGVVRVGSHVLCRCGVLMGSWDE